MLREHNDMELVSKIKDASVNAECGNYERDLDHRDHHKEKLNSMPCPEQVSQALQ